MGMAASQARYLALVARKSNCEYEGQQINQARTVLSNQSASLFNQMLGLSVPVPPSTLDYTKQQYSFTDGVNESTIDSWQQLASPEDEYNYVVTHHYYADVYTGSQKQKNDPQVQFASGTPSSVEQIETALRLVTETKKEYEEAKAATSELKEKAATLTNYADTTSYTNITGNEYNVNQDTYIVKNNNSVQKTINGYPVYKTLDGTEYYLNTDQDKYYAMDGVNTPFEGDEATLIPSYDNASYYTGYSKLTQTQQELVRQQIEQLIQIGALDEDVTTDYANVYFNEADNTIAFKEDLRSLYGSTSTSTRTTLPVYQTTGDNSIEAIKAEYDAQIATLQAAQDTAMQAYNTAEQTYESLQRPTYLGNNELTLLTDLTADQAAELRQVVADMTEQGINASINNCFDADGNYLGGVYSFQLNGITYYTTFEDLYNSYQGGNGINNIDNQPKLAYYNASYVSTKIEQTEKALLETDGNGRFTSVRFEDDTITYTLNVETVTDDVAYQDAMNQYNYENAIYDKMVQDINAKTSLIQQEDQQLELRLKQLDTEQNALSTEIDAVSKVVKDNIEDSFKTFGG